MIYLKPVLAGSVIGIIYGLLFILQQKKLFAGNIYQPMIFIMPLIRILCIAFMFCHLLRLPLLHSILTLSTFIGSWWAVILVQKSRLV